MNSGIAFNVYGYILFLQTRSTSTAVVRSFHLFLDRFNQFYQPCSATLPSLDKRQGIMSVPRLLVVGGNGFLGECQFVRVYINVDSFRIGGV